MRDAITPCSNTFFLEVIMSLPVAIQLYSLRNELDRDFKGTLEEVK